MIKKIRILAVPIVLAVIPVLRYISDFKNGARCGPYLSGIGFFIFLILPWVVGLFAGLVVPLSKTWHKIVIGIAAGMLLWPIISLTTPAGAVIYSRGFEYAIQKDPGIEVLQEWAIETLKNFDTGQVDWTEWH
ncbi:MAG: hypothetical protein JJU29_12875 [Verrucomicrobia bacterium]|nr:hypothetical protein [Verrucomicrobiota bacterium]MCH8512597.1 hypothetical protein [Kiritimatiellia bacterium]